MNELELLNKRIERERQARKQAEAILEKKALELFTTNEKLRKLNESLESEIIKRMAELKESEVKYRSVMENMDLGLLEVDNEGKIIRAYDKFLNMTGYTEEELVGQDAKDLLITDEYKDVLTHQENKRLNGIPDVYEVVIKKKNGERRWVLISGAPFHNEKGEVIGSLGIHYDITDRKNLELSLKKAKEEAIRAQEAEKEFLARMSHEIRTPLNAIIGMTHLISETKLDESQENLIEILLNSADILKNLVSDILDISKIDSGAIEIQNKDFDLRRQANILMQTISLKNRNKAIDYRVKFEDEIPLRVCADQQILNQILLNLLSNAEKFTEEGFIELRIRKVDETKEDIKLIFEIEDTGKGMTGEELDRIFVNFRQANKNISKKYGGTGLGIPIANKLLNLLGSELSVESSLNKGSRFYFELRLLKAENKPIIELEEDITDDIDFGKISVLIAEDNTMNIQYITRLFQKWGIEFQITMNGKEAIEAFENNQFDLILMDLSMPVMSGFEASRKIREMRVHGGDTIPIIALTASTFMTKRQLAKGAGMTDFLSKPFTPIQMREILKKYTRHNVADQHKVQSDLVTSELDRETLVNLYGNDHDYALEMFQLFLDTIDGELDRLNTFLADQDIQAVKKQLHKIKPGLLMVGLKGVHGQLESLESEISMLPSDELRLNLTSLIKEIRTRKTQILRHTEILEQKVK